MKPIKYFLIIFVFFISNSNAITFTNDKEIDPNTKEYKLIREYRKTTCAFIDKNTDYKIQKRCFEMTKKLFKLTENKTFLTILARQYVHGIGVAKDFNKGLKLYEEVARSDFKDAVEAQDFLGVYYGAADNPVKDKLKEEYWLKKAAFNGSDFSQYHYAGLLKNQGKAKEALYWLKKAAYNGNLEAKCTLAILVRTGGQAEINRTEAYKLLHEAAEQDFAPAFQELSFYYKEDDNKERSNYWHHKFINSDVFKKIASGMDPLLAINQVYFEQKKKKYIEAQKEMEQIEKTNKTAGG